MEIREPFGSGIVRYLGTEAIRQIPPRPRQTLFCVSFRERKRSCRSFALRMIIFTGSNSWEDLQNSCEGARSLCEAFHNRSVLSGISNLYFAALDPLLKATVHCNMIIRSAKLRQDLLRSRKDTQKSV